MLNNLQTTNRRAYLSGAFIPRPGSQVLLGMLKHLFTYFCSPKSRIVVIRVFFLLLLALPFSHTVAQSQSDSVPLQDTTKAVIRRGMDTTIHRPRKKVLTPPKKDSLATRAKDSLPSVTMLPLVLPPPPEREDFVTVLKENPWYNFMHPGLSPAMQVHQASSYDTYFYLLVGILFYFALVKMVFGKYMSNLFTLFFRVSMRQQQIRDQVTQSPLPSLLFNILFFISGGLYGCFLLYYFRAPVHLSFWALFLNSVLILVVVYLAKFVLLKSIGWIFNIQRATDTYIFIVFMTNKILGIFLLPFNVILSLSGRIVSESAVTLSLVMITFLLIRRFAISYAPLRKEIKLNAFYFFLYLCAFEIAPLLLIYKVLLDYLEKAY